jgi:DNA-binding transcriptional ArsR family regulator
MGPVLLFERAAGGAVATAAEVRPDQLALATPCTEWDVAALLAHMQAGTSYLLGSLGSDDPQEAEYGAAVAQCLRALRRPGVPSGDARDRPQGRDRRTGGVGGAGRACPGPAPRRDGAPAMSEGSPLDDAVRAMGHPGRRAMLRLARDGERSASELAAAANLSASAASPHLKLLRDAGLMHVRVDAKRRLYRVDVTRLAEVKAVLDELWGGRLDALKASAEAGPASRRRGRSA